MRSSNKAWSSTKWPTPVTYLNYLGLVRSSGPSGPHHPERGINAGWWQNTAPIHLTALFKIGKARKRPPQQWSGWACWLPQRWWKWTWESTLHFNAKWERSESSGNKAVIISDISERQMAGDVAHTKVKALKWHSTCICTPAVMIFLFFHSLLYFFFNSTISILNVETKYYSVSFTSLIFFPLVHIFSLLLFSRFLLSSLPYLPSSYSNWLFVTIAHLFYFQTFSLSPPGFFFPLCLSMLCYQ